MQCPVCDESLREIERHGVAIDICPGCKGVWLDRGELDKIIAMSRAEEAEAPAAISAGAARDRLPQAPAPRHAEPPRARHHDDDDEDHDHGRREHHGHDEGGHYPPQGDGRGQYQSRRRGSWLTDVLESLGGGD